MRKFIPKSAFSLIELTIALLIIGIIMSAIAGGVKMVTSTRLTNARSLTANSPVPKIDGLVAWYETSRRESFKTDEAVDDGQISTWYDVSPGSITKQRNPLTRAVSNAVIYQLNGINKLPSIYFNGSGSISLENFYQGTTSQNTVFIVANPHDITSSLFDSASSVTTSVVQLSDEFMMDCSDGFGYGMTGDLSLVNNPNVPYIAVIYYNDENSKVYFNDATNMAGGTTIDPGPTFGATNKLTGFLLGAIRVSTPGSSNYTGLISEVIIYNRPLQTQERKDVMNYLSQKYGITVSGV